MDLTPPSSWTGSRHIFDSIGLKMTPALPVGHFLKDPSKCSAAATAADMSIMMKIKLSTVSTMMMMSTMVMIMVSTVSTMVMMSTMVRWLWPKARLEHDNLLGDNDFIRRPSNISLARTNTPPKQKTS